MRLSKMHHKYNKKNTCSHNHTRSPYAQYKNTTGHGVPTHNLFANFQQCTTDHVDLASIRATCMRPYSVDKDAFAQSKFVYF